MSRTFSHSPMDFRMMSPAIQFLLISYVAMFGLDWIVGHHKFSEIFGLVPAHVIDDRWVWQLVTYTFIHANVFHLLLNSFALWMFAMPVEAQWGSKEFLKYYFLCGIAGGLAQLGVAPHSMLPIVGASGAIMGLLVAFAMLYPDAVIYLYMLLPMRAKHFAILYGVVEFFTGVSDNTPGVARFAHLGGMIVGYLYIRWWWIFKIKLKGLWYELTPRPAAGGRSWRTSLGAGSSLKASPEPKQSQTAIQYEDPMSEVDRVLDKMLEHGQSALSPEELEILKRHAQRNKPEGNA